MSSPLSPAVVDALRARTPGVLSTTHFNHAGASLPSAATLEAIHAHLLREASMGPMEAGAAASDKTERARTLAARLLNAQPAEIALTTGNSPGWGAAFAALGPWREGQRILVARHEWGGNLATMRILAQRAGALIETIPSDASGRVDPGALEAMLDDRVRLIALTWLPANGGLINPASAIGRIARRHGIPYFIDAAQAIGQLPIDVVELGLRRAGGRGPQGTARTARHRAVIRAAGFSAPLDASLRRHLFRAARRQRRAGTARRCRASRIIGSIDCTALRIGECIGRSAGNRHRQYPRADRSDRSAAARAVGRDAGRVRTRSGCRTIRSGVVQRRRTRRHVVRRALAAQGITIGSNGVGYTPFDMTIRGLTQIARASVSYLTTDAEVDKLLAGIRTLAH
ncbi:cysteine desulfurase/selenocysteine lyase [Paraburkholderia youngii]